LIALQKESVVLTSPLLMAHSIDSLQPNWFSMCCTNWLYWAGHL